MEDRFYLLQGLVGYPAKSYIIEVQYKFYLKSFAFGCPCTHTDTVQDVLQGWQSNSSIPIDRHKIDIVLRLSPDEMLLINLGRELLVFQIDL